MSRFNVIGLLAVSCLAATGTCAETSKFAFGKFSIYQAGDSQESSDGTGFEFGGGLFMNEHFGFVASISRAEGNSSDSELRDCDDLSDPALCTKLTSAGISLTLLDNDYIKTSSGPVTSFMMESVLRWKYNDDVFVLLGGGVHYSTMEAELVASIDLYDLLKINYRDTAQYSGFGMMGSIGAGFSVKDNLDVTLSFKKRFGELEADDDSLLEFFAFDTALGGSIDLGFVLKF